MTHSKIRTPWTGMCIVGILWVIFASTLLHASAWHLPLSPPWEPVSPFSIVPSSPHYEELLQGRIDAAIHSQKWDIPGGALGWECSDAYSDPDQGKYVWPIFLAAMYDSRNNTAKLKEYITRNASFGVLGAAGWLDTQKCGTFWKPFNAEGLTTYFLAFRDLINQTAPEQFEKIHLMLLREGREQVSRPTHHLDPIYWLEEFDSENYFWMSRSSGALWEEIFPSPVVYGPELGSIFPNGVRAFLGAGRLEWDSTIYAGFVLQPLMNVYTFSKNTTRRSQARALLDWMLLTMSIKYLDGGMVGPDARAKDIGALPLTGSAWFYMWLLTTDARYHPSFHPQTAANATSSTFLAQFPFSTYRPPQAALNIAQRRFSTPVLMHNAKPFYLIDVDNYAQWDGEHGRRFEFETMLLERNFTLGSLAAGRPNGMFHWNQFGLYGNGESPFWEESVWRLGVLSDGVTPGPQQVFGNTGREFPDLNGRSPYEQIGQGSIALVRAFLATDVTWVAVPNTTTTITGTLSNNPAVFVSCGHGVFAAFGAASSDPDAALTLSTQPFPRSSQRATQFLWHGFSNTSLSMATVEVGTATQYSSLAAFKSHVEAKARLEFQGHNIATLTTASIQETVSVLHTGFDTNFHMIDGTKVTPAGSYPNVTVNGTIVDFFTFDSYKVVQGENILEQRWGSGELTAQADGVGHRIVVDMESGTPSFYEYGV